MTSTLIHPERTFQKVLVANRGEIALRVLRALKGLNIPSVVIYHQTDALSPVVREANEAVEIHGHNANAAYLDINQIVDVCRRHQVQAVHPGYGYLSESSDFARALNEAGITFIGPSPAVIELMGDKITSRNFALERGFPTPPSISVDVQATGTGVEHYVRLVEETPGMRLPLVVKASAGGGGKGMSIVRSYGELESALRIASSEAEKYFGDARIYLERYFTNARHIEVQVIGDGRNVIHVGERDCSVQRRFQKIIEESPSPALSDEMRGRLCEVARSIAAAANYTSVGTVEFLYTPEGEFFFLEMNTRIQVEHPVTEMVYGLDLVVEQIRIAAGNPLSIAQKDLVPRGHAIECRVCAEDAFNNFSPETGRVLFLQLPTLGGTRFDSGLYQNQVVTTNFDPMLAKLVVHAPSRREALAKADEALRQLVVLGVKVNTPYLRKLLAHPSFVEGNYDTTFTSKYAGELNEPPVTDPHLAAVLAAAYLSDRETQLLQAATPEPYAAIGHWRN